MQNISDDLNKMKRSSFVALRFKDSEAETETTSGDQLREKIQKWLSPPDPSINHNTACEAHHNGTAAWFIEGSIYNEWKATGSFLWTYGNRRSILGFPPTLLMISGFDRFVAGSGKSVLWWVTLLPTFLST